MRGGRWSALPVEWWRDIAAALDGQEWPTEAAQMDLRIMDQHGRIPGRPTLRRRWGWTDHRVKKLLQNDHLWKENRQPVASPSPENQAKTQDKPYRAASPSPENRHTRANYNYNSLLDSLPSVEGLREATEAYLHHRRGLGLECGPRDLRQISERITEGHQTGLDVVAALRLSVAKNWKWFFPKSPTDFKKKGPKFSPATKNSEWSIVVDALHHWGRKPPDYGRNPWGFTEDPHTEARYLEAIKSAGESQNLLAAWINLHENAGDKKYMKWARIRFIQSYTHTTHTQRETA